MNYFDSVCRLCLTQTGLYHIFETQDLQQDIYLCIGISMLSTDPLPQRICEKCFTIVINAKKLRLIATANDTNLKIFCDNINSDIQIQNTAEENSNSVNEINGGTIETILVNNEKPTDNLHMSYTDNCNLNAVVITDKPFELDISRDSTGQAQKISVRNYLYKEKSPSTEDSIEPVKSPCEEEEKNTECNSTNITKVESDDKNNIKTYKCNLCVKYFKTWRQAYLHERVHCKYIKCEVCSKWFACKSDLVKHTRVHTGEKPFKCTLCEKSFSQRVTLRQHRKNIHNLKYMDDDIKPRVNDAVPVTSNT